MFDPWRGFKDPQLSKEWKSKLTELGNQGRGDIIKMTTLAASGHPGGSMSSFEVYLILYHMAKVDPKDPYRDDRDRIIISHGHTSPGAYAALGLAGFFDIELAISGFRQAGSPFEGHVERSVPGIEWDTGNLGQGLAVGIGKAIYARLSGYDSHTFVMMGDGEQQKGQIGESRRHAIKFGLNDVTAIIDLNRLQISGDTGVVMPMDIIANWKADGWKVIEVDAHDLDQVYGGLFTAVNDHTTPYVIIANSVMGKGVSFMENKAAYHGAAIKPDQVDAALKELGGLENDLEKYKAMRQQGPPPQFDIKRSPFPQVKPGERVIYPVDTVTDNRSAYGKALLSVAEANASRDNFKMAVFDCDLAGSVKTTAIEKALPQNFFQFGISEHATAASAGSLSAENALSVWAAFGMFGIVETYNQARLNDINHSNLKLFCTHSGIDVGEDGKTHQCIDYFSLLNSTFGWKVITPADPNQTDAIVRYALTTPGNVAVVMGRSKLPTVTDKTGKAFFGEGYRYEYGRMATIRRGEDIAIVCSGNMLVHGFEAWNLLASEGVAPALISVSDWTSLHNDDLTMLGEFDHLVTVEDHNVKTGLGSAIAAAMFQLRLSSSLTKMGVENYAPSGKSADLYKHLGLDGESIAATVNNLAKKGAAV